MSRTTRLTRLELAAANRSQPLSPGVQAAIAAFFDIVELIPSSSGDKSGRLRSPGLSDISALLTRIDEGKTTTEDASLLLKMKPHAAALGASPEYILRGLFNPDARASTTDVRTLSDDQLHSIIASGTSKDIA